MSREMIKDSYFQVMIGGIVTNIHVAHIQYGKVFYAMKALEFESEIKPNVMDRDKFKLHYWDKGFNFVNENGAFKPNMESLPQVRVGLTPEKYIEVKFKLDPNKLTDKTWENFLTQVNEIRVNSNHITTNIKLDFNNPRFAALVFKSEKEVERLMTEVLPFYINNGITIDGPKNLRNRIREVNLTFRGYDRFYDTYNVKDSNSYNSTKRKDFLDKFFATFKANFGKDISGHAGIINMFLGEKDSQDYVNIKVLVINTDQVKSFRHNLMYGLEHYIDFVYSVEEIEEQ